MTRKPCQFIDAFVNMCNDILATYGFTFALDMISVTAVSSKSDNNIAVGMKITHGMVVTKLTNI